MATSTSIKAHFDGMVLVPDQEVDLPVNLPLTIYLQSVADAEGAGLEQLIAGRIERLAAAHGRVTGPCVTGDALNRDNLYDERT